MVRKANLVFGTAILFSVGMVYYIHYAQKQEILELKKGVERDRERRLFRKAQKEEQSKAQTVS